MPARLLATSADLAARGLKPGELDFVLVTGDAYVDHPSFGMALLGRLLEDEGFTVGILARPDPDDAAAFRLLGRPRLAWLVTAGALDSMVSSYTANNKPRSEDGYAPGGRPELCLRADGTIGTGRAGRRNARPDRAVITYATKCREAFPSARAGPGTGTKPVAGAKPATPVVIGGIEASLRRFAHYDYWSDSLRRSILLDAKADILVYGMGEAALVEIAQRLRGAADSAAPDAAPDRGAAGIATAVAGGALRGIRGTAWRTGRDPGLEPGSFTALPHYATVKADAAAYAEAARLLHRNAEARSGARLVEETDGRWVVQEPPAFPLDGRGLDRLYELPYLREAHPAYDAFGGVPALDEVRFSLVSSRGCFGGCSFCAIALHQGRSVTARTEASLVREAAALTRLPGWKGYIHDVGGPTANFRVPACARMGREGACPDRLCLSPEPCPNLRPDHRNYVDILRALRAVPGVRKVFIRSGIRFDYLLLDPEGAFLEELAAHHVSGQLKVAPEHVSEGVLALMGKPGHRMYDEFCRRFTEASRRAGKRQFVIPYFISGHPGAGLPEAIELALHLRDAGFVPDQVQDFYPTPGSLATAMWHTGLDPLTGRPVHVARGARERAMQRALLQWNRPGNRELVREALLLAGRSDLIGRGPGCLVP